MIGAKKKEGFFTGSDGIELYYHSHVPKRPKGIMAVAHGLGEHSQRYQNLIDYFLPQGWGLYLMDHRGHGRSPGPRVHTPRLATMVQDLACFLKKVGRETEEYPLFLVGHSFGGQIAVNYLADHPAPLRGTVLSSPNLKLSLPVSWIKKFAARQFSFFLPTVSLPGDIDPSYVSHDPKVVHEYRTDPLVSQRISLRMGSEILDNLDHIMQLAPKIRVPALLMHGGSDQITAVEGTQEFFKKMKVVDRELKIYPELFHELFNEIGKERIFADMQKWLDARI